MTDWCTGSCTRPTDVADRNLADGTVATGVCFACHRRVRLTTQGHLRRHHPTVAPSVAAMRHPAAAGTLPPRRTR